MELSDHFSFRPEGYQYTPAFKSKFWDGYVRLFSVTRKSIYVGLHYYILNFCEQMGYTYEDLSGLSEEKNEYSREYVELYVRNVLRPSSAGKAIEIREYQLAAIHHAINERRCIVESPTSCLDPDTIIEVELDSIGYKLLTELRNQ